MGGSGTVSVVPPEINFHKLGFTSDGSAGLILRGRWGACDRGPAHDDDELMGLLCDLWRREVGRGGDETSTATAGEVVVEGWKRGRG